MGACSKGDVDTGAEVLRLQEIKLAEELAVSMAGRVRDR
jgi:hypothetical protein